MCLEGNKNLTLKPNETIKIQKYTKRGLYSMKVKVCAAGDENYNFATQTVNVTIQVKLYYAKHCVFIVLCYEVLLWVMSTEK